MATNLAKAAEREERRDKVMAFVLGGASTRQIARNMGFSRTTVQRDINARLEAAASQCPDTINYRQLQRNQLNSLLVTWWPRAREDLSALDRVLRILEREAKLLGLDAPVKQEITGPDDEPVQAVRPDLSELSLEDLDALRTLARTKDDGARNSLSRPDTLGRSLSVSYTQINDENPFHLGYLINADFPERPSQP